MVSCTYLFILTTSSAPILFLDSYRMPRGTPSPLPTKDDAIDQQQGQMGKSSSFAG